MAPQTEKSKQDPIALLRQLEWRVRNAVAEVVTGEYRSAFRGRGMEFDQVVRYEFGDDVRDIDWNVTARLGEPYRKKFVEEREVTLLVVLEDTPSLQFGSATRTKRAALLELAGLVMLLGAINRDRVGVLRLTPGGHAFTPPLRGRGAILHAASRLIASEPPALATTGAVNVPSSLLLRAAPKHSIVLWLGDFPPGPMPEGWPLLQRRYQTMGFRIDDPWERTLPVDRAFHAYDPVAGRIVALDGSRQQREAHARWKTAREAAWAKRFPDPLSRLSVSTTDGLLDALVSFFRRRMAGAGR